MTLEEDAKIALSVIQELEELEEEKANGLSENESDELSTLSDNNYRYESPLSSSCNLQDKIEKFKELINKLSSDNFYDEWKDKMVPLYEKLENSTLSKKEKIKIMLCGAYLQDYGKVLGDDINKELERIFPDPRPNPEFIEEIIRYLDSNQHLVLGLKELEKKKNDENGNKIFNALNSDHILVYILHNVIL